MKKVAERKASLGVVSAPSVIGLVGPTQEIDRKHMSRDQAREEHTEKYMSQNVICKKQENCDKIEAWSALTTR